MDPLGRQFWMLRLAFAGANCYACRPRLEDFEECPVSCMLERN